jgi:hypothetical protein
LGPPGGSGGAGGASTGRSATVKPPLFAPRSIAMLRPSSSIVTGTRSLGTRQENMRITGEGETRPAPKLPVMPTTPPVAIGAISRPSSASASFWSCLAAILTTTSRLSSVRACGP